MSALTLKSSASGQEEIQVSESNKINTSQIAALAPSQQLTGFTALTAGKPAITANTTLLAAIQSLYAMVGSGKVKIVSDGADQTGMVCWNGTLASGFVINLDESAIYIRSQWTLASPDSVTDANWIAAVKFGATKTPFAAAAGQNPNLGDLPISSNVKFEDSKVGIGSMLRMLTAAANVGRMRIVSGNPLTGASGKPELAFIVNIIQGVNAETDDTFGLQIFHLTNDYIRVIPSSSVDITWTALQSMTDEAVIKRLNSTSGWGGLGVKLPWTGGNVIHGEDITEGLEYLIPENVGDVVAFRSTMDSSQVPAEQEGFGFLAKVNGSESMAMMMQNDPAGGGKMKFFMGRVQNDGTGTDWQELTAGGMETLWTPTEATYVMVDTDAGYGDPVQINLTRALKATDRVLITWRKQNTSYFGVDVPGQAIINPNAYAHDVFLELVENFVIPSEYYGLFLDQGTTEAGSEVLIFFAASWGGNTYGPQYLITGIYNISGK